jgi:hypothetical protein
MDLVNACGGYYVAGIGVDFLALGAVGLVLARKWPASRWLSAALTAWYLSSALPATSAERWHAFVNYAAQSGAELFTIGCGLLAVLLPFLASPAPRWRLGRPRPRRVARAYGLVVSIHDEPATDTSSARQ